MSTLTIDLLPVGRSLIPGPELYWMNAWDEWHPLTFQVALIRGEGICALVNTGPAQDLGPMNDGWASFLGERARMERDDGEFIIDQLEHRGIQPGDVTHIILTPLQLYTVSNVLRFPNASINISKRGWVHFHTTHDHPHDDRATSIPDDILTELVTTAWPRVNLLNDEHVIAPGLRTWWSGGHHRASVVVEVDTNAGVVALSDTYFYRDNVLNNHPIGITESIEESLAAFQRIRTPPDHIVGLYDPDNFNRYQNGSIT